MATKANSKVSLNLEAMSAFNALLAAFVRSAQDLQNTVNSAVRYFDESAGNVSGDETTSGVESLENMDKITREVVEKFVAVESKVRAVCEKHGALTTQSKISLAEAKANLDAVTKKMKTQMGA